MFSTNRMVKKSPWCHWKVFILHNPSGRTMALGLIQTLTEISNTNISWG